MINKKITGFNFFMKILGILLVFFLCAKGIQFLTPSLSITECGVISIFICLVCGVGHNLKDFDEPIKEERRIPVIGTKQISTDEIDYQKGIPTQKQWEESLIDKEIRPQNGESRRITTCTKLGVEVINDPPTVDAEKLPESLQVFKPNNPF